MKKFFAGIIILFVLMVSLPVAADAQNRYNRNRRSSVSNRDYRYENRDYRNRNYRNRNYRNNNYRRQSFYQRNRNLINIGAGTGAGALIGGIVGGKKGALIGAAIGAGSSAIYTYKIRPKKRYYRR